MRATSFQPHDRRDEKYREAITAGGDLLRETLVNTFASASRHSACNQAGTPRASMGLQFRGAPQKLHTMELMRAKEMRGSRLIKSWRKKPEVAHFRQEGCCQSIKRRISAAPIGVIYRARRRPLALRSARRASPARLTRRSFRPSEADPRRAALFLSGKRAGNIAGFTGDSKHIQHSRRPPLMNLPSAPPCNSEGRRRSHGLFLPLAPGNNKAGSSAIRALVFLLY